MLRQLSFCPPVHCGTCSRRLSPGSGGMTEGNLGCTMAKPTDQKTRFLVRPRVVLAQAMALVPFPRALEAWQRSCFGVANGLSGGSVARPTGTVNAHRYLCTPGFPQQLSSTRCGNDLAAAAASGVRHVRLALTAPHNQQRPRAPTAAWGTPCTLGPDGTTHSIRSQRRPQGYPMYAWPWRHTQPADAVPIA